MGEQLKLCSKHPQNGYPQRATFEGIARKPKAPVKPLLHAPTGNQFQYCNPRTIIPEFMTYCGLLRNPFRTVQKPWYSTPWNYQLNVVASFPQFLLYRWCEIERDVVHPSVSFERHGCYNPRCEVGVQEAWPRISSP